VAHPAHEIVVLVRGPVLEAGRSHGPPQALGGSAGLRVGARLDADDAAGEQVSVGGVEARPVRARQGVRTCHAPRDVGRVCAWPTGGVGERCDAL
jgi:hypothetical protein